METERRLVIASTCRERQWGVIANGYGVAFWGDENVLQQ